MVIGTSTIPLTSAATGLGPVIMSGFGTVGPSATSTAGVEGFTGAGAKVEVPRIAVLVLGVGIGVLGLVGGWA